MLSIAILVNGKKLCVMRCIVPTTDPFLYTSLSSIGNDLEATKIKLSLFLKQGCLAGGLGCSALLVKMRRDFADLVLFLMGV